MSQLQNKIRELHDAHGSGVKDISGDSFKSYSDIYQSSLRFSNVFGKYHKEVISVVLPNSIEYIEVLIACLLTGNIFNPIPFFTSDEELERIFEYIEPKMVITTRDVVQKFTPRLHVLNPQNYTDVSKEIVTLTESSAGGSDVAALYYSSGTTGSPKGVLYSHDNIFYLIESINRGFGFNEDTKHLAILPFGHTASINYNIFPCLFNRSNLVLADSFSNIASRFFRILSDEKINYAQIVPTIVYMLLKIRYQTQRLDFSSLMFLGCGSSILPLESQMQFEKQYGIKIGNLYGLSETGPTHIDDPRSAQWKPGTIGLALDVNQCKISENSELQIKGRNVFLGYYKNHKLYQEVVKDGWFSTGDIVSYENNKYVYKDRAKDLIIKGGINIVPAELEEILYTHPSVQEAVVVGISHDIHGEDIISAVTLKDELSDQESIKSELYGLLSQKLSSYKHPVDIIFLETLPKTHSGKLKRKEVRRILDNHDCR